MNKSITIKDIAKQLGISIATVSRALQGSTNIKPETKAKVVALAKELNYSPNPIALSLKHNRTKTLGILVPEIATSFFGKVIAGIEDEAYKRGYYVMICQTHENYELEKLMLQQLLQRKVEGIILTISSETNKYDHITALDKMEVPYVMFDRVVKDIYANKVIADDTEGAYAAVEHLIHQKYKRIAHVTLNKHLSITQNRLQGYKEALRKNKLNTSASLVKHCSVDVEQVKKSVRELLTQKTKPDAILVGTELSTLACLEVIKELNIAVPKDLGLVAFTNNPLSSLLKPSLSTVSLPGFEMGIECVRMLIDSIENPSKAKKTVQLNTRLHARETSLRKKK